MFYIYIYLYTHMDVSSIYVSIHPRTWRWLHLSLLDAPEGANVYYVQLRRFWGVTCARGLMNRRSLFGSILSHSHIHGGTVTGSHVGRMGAQLALPVSMAPSPPSLPTPLPPSANTGLHATWTDTLSHGAGRDSISSWHSLIWTSMNGHPGPSAWHQGDIYSLINSIHTAQLS